MTRSTYLTKTEDIIHHLTHGINVNKYVDVMDGSSNYGKDKDIGKVVAYCSESGQWVVQLPAWEGGKDFDGLLPKKDGFLTASYMLRATTAKIHVGVCGHFSKTQGECPVCRKQLLDFVHARREGYNRAAQSHLETKDLTQIREWGIDLDINLVHECANYYALSHLGISDSYFQSMFKSNAKRLAKIFYQYSFMVCGAELRHLPQRARYGEVSGTDLQTLFSGGLPRTRGEAHEKWMNSKVPEADLLQMAIRLFPLFTDGAFGGSSWAKIAQNALMYKTGEITPATFVDTCWGLHHNGNVFFDKCYTVKPPLLTILDAGREENMAVIYPYVDDPEVRRELEKRDHIPALPDWDEAPQAGLVTNDLNAKEIPVLPTLYLEDGEPATCSCRICQEKAKKEGEHVAKYVTQYFDTRPGKSGELDLDSEDLFLTEGGITKETGGDANNIHPGQAASLKSSKFKPEPIKHLTIDSKQFKAYAEYLEWTGPDAWGNLSKSGDNPGDSPTPKDES